MASSNGDHTTTVDGVWGDVQTGVATNVDVSVGDVVIPRCKDAPDDADLDPYVTVRLIARQSADYDGSAELDLSRERAAELRDALDEALAAMDEVDDGDD